VVMLAVNLASKAVLRTLMAFGFRVVTALTLSALPTTTLAQSEPTSSEAISGSAESDLGPGVGNEMGTPDRITNERILRLTEDGLIERQATLSEGLLLMDRQLRQMQLVEQILAAYGPDALVEIAPGEYKSFKDTPAGMRQEIQYLDLQIQLSQKRAEFLQAQVKQGDTAAVRGFLVDEDVRTSGEPAFSNDAVLDGLVLEEIYGQIGRLNAVVLVAGETVTVRSSDSLPTGHLVVAVGPDKLTVELGDGSIREFQIR
jgi:hypothetical protein